MWDTKVNYCHNPKIKTRENLNDMPLHSAMGKVHLNTR